MRREQLNRRTHQTSAAAKAERHKSPRIIQRGRAVRAGGGGGLKVFVITGLATGRGLYECKECLFDATDWNAETNVQKFGAIGNTVEVFNTGENKSVVGSILLVGDFLLAFQHTDDEGNVRWIGFSPKYSWWHGGF